MISETDLEPIIQAIMREDKRFTREQAGIMLRLYLPEIIARRVVGMYWEDVARNDVRNNYPEQLRSMDHDLATFDRVCDCDLRDRQWNLNTGRCNTCGLVFRERNKNASIIQTV